MLYAISFVVYLKLFFIDETRMERFQGDDIMRMQTHEPRNEPCTCSRKTIESVDRPTWYCRINRLVVWVECLI